VVSYLTLDRQLAQYSRKLTTEVRLKEGEAFKVATLVASEVRLLDNSSKLQVLKASPVLLTSRLAELKAFQRWSEMSSRIHDPAIVRAQVIVQNYVCFVYLGEACFRALVKVGQPDSVIRRCCKYLTDNPIRAFRNAIAHANWAYADDFDALIYWARKGADQHEPLSRFEVTQSELDFWQTLSRGVAYAAYTELESVHVK
jgi:hypothetical protein